MTDKKLGKITKRLANEGLKTMDFFRAIAAEDWDKPVYTNGAGWTVCQILMHLLNAEQGFHHLISDIMLGGSGAPEDMDLDEFNEQQIDHQTCDNPERTLNALAQARVTTIEIVRGLQPADLAREGRHPFLGITTVDKMLQLIYRHTMLHQRDIRRALDQGQPVDLEN
jgi:hypothetical protein